MYRILAKSVSRGLSGPVETWNPKVMYLRDSSLDTPVAGNVDDWDFRGSDTQYGTHGMHTYVAAMIPQLARRLIEEYTPAGGTVLDPFCGGGSVLVEAVNSGRPAIGRDVNPLATLISKAKTTPIDPHEARQVLGQIVSRVDPKGHPPLIDKNLAFWFKPEHTGPLHSLRTAIALVLPNNDPLTTLFQVVFSSTVRDVSLTYRNEVRLRRMTEDEIERFKVCPILRFRERAKKAIAAVADLPGLALANVSVGTAQALDLNDGECAAVICSPPYGDERNGVSYTQFSKNMLAWLGYSRETLRESKGLTLGWGNEGRAVPQSPTLAAALDAICEFLNLFRERLLSTPTIRLRSEKWRGSHTGRL